MNRQEKMINKMREIAQLNPEKIHIIETNVGAEMQLEFFETLQSFTKEENIPKPEQIFENLNNPEASLEEKKKCLALLASLGEVDSFRMIENYLENPEKELQSWAFLAYQQARMFLEANLLDEEKIYIASGLGGKGHRLRYAFCFIAKENFTETQQNILKGEIEYSFSKNDSILEELSFIGKYAIGTVLIALQVDIVDLIENIIREVNQYGNFLHENIYITNEKKINPNQLDDLLKRIENTNYIPDKD
ncbi:MAG TPA: hypothetical protein PLW23_06325 [Bacteroidales bacterium]|nr:hypothetical protein [Bacteroidales bacterium]